MQESQNTHTHTYLHSGIGIESILIFDNSTSAVDIYNHTQYTEFIRISHILLLFIIYKNENNKLKKC